MSLRKFSGIVPEVMAEISRLIDAKHEEKRVREREGVREDVQAGKAGDAGDLQVENQPVDPRMRARRARRGRGGRQLELGLTITKR
tara:strand:+ start:105 stop:362 length:258 start_codon:yes stop_codon:yes gene_type:complete